MKTTARTGNKVLTKGDWAKNDLAKYPFIPQAAEYVKRLGIQIEDLTNPEYTSILDRAENRIQEAIFSGIISHRSLKDDIEIPSFPLAIMMVAATGDSYAKKRYATAEAKRFSSLLRGEEHLEKIMGIAENFKWKIKPASRNVGTRNYDFTLHFTDFLRNSAVFHENEWKLVNRLIFSGDVYLTKNDAGRLLEEEVRRYVEDKLRVRVESLPETVMNRMARLKQFSQEKKSEIKLREFPKEVAISAFPPCIKHLHDTIASGRQVSHIGRFTLTSFLINIGMTVENVMDHFRTASDFDERMARYQIEHIAGVRGSRTKYRPPTCDTLRTHRLCQRPEETCKEVRHPLTYYRRKLRNMKTKPS